jgi:hypothetical protein
MAPALAISPYPFFRYSLIPRLHLCLLVFDKANQIVVQRLLVGVVRQREGIAFQGAVNVRTKAEVVNVGYAIVVKAQRQKGDWYSDSVDKRDVVVFEPEFCEVFAQAVRKNGKGVVIESQMPQSGRKHRRQSRQVIVGGDEGVEAGGEDGG